jgi:pyocin large subunit-like protein
VTKLPTWSPSNLQRHFRKHGRKFSCLTVVDYAASSLTTIASGTRFTFHDDDSGEDRVGYYHAATNRLTIVSDDEHAIITHFLPSRGEQYCRDQTDSTYR